jgi:hypothetical protein
MLYLKYMDIVVGIDSLKTPAEIKPLVDAGAEEFFCGYIPEFWSGKYGWEIAPNRRPYQAYNYLSFEGLSAAVSAVHSFGKKILLAINEHEYPPERMAFAVRIAKEATPLRFDGIIISNIALALELREAGIDVPLHISIGGLANNYEAILFYNKHIPNIRRFILPRDVTVSEIRSLAEKARTDGVALEAFGIGDPCAYSDGYCPTWHSSLNPPFCAWFLNGKRKLVDIASGSGKEAAPEVAVDFGGMDVNSDREQFLSSVVRTCGLCSVPLFKKWGVSAIKVPLRGGVARDILISYVKQAMDLEFPEDCKKIIGSRNFCSGARCYYNYPSEKNV